MKVEIWSDIACPFCYIGKHQFEAGLEKFAHKDQVSVEYRSFQLDPYADKEPTQDLYDKLAAKMGRSREEVKALNQQIAQQGQSLGLDFQFDTVIPANTMEGHRLIKFADAFDKKAEVVERLYKAYFTESKSVADYDTLADIAQEAGIEREQAIEMLKSTQYVNEVRADGQEASSVGATGVPFFVINRKYAVSGARPSEHFLAALQQAWEDEHPLIDVSQPTSDACDDGYCKP